MPYLPTLTPYGLTRDFIACIDTTFIVHLRNRGLSETTIRLDRWAVRYAARFLARRERTLDSLRPEEFAPFLHDSIPARWRSLEARKKYAGAIRRWLRFRYPACVLPPSFAPSAPRQSPQKTFHGKPASAYPWYQWVHDYLQFLQSHRGLCPGTCRRIRYAVCDYLYWQFGGKKAGWRRVAPDELWRYAREFGRGRKPATLNQELGRLRHFLDFVHMRGACAPGLARAVPRFANYGQGASRRDVLSDAQRRWLLASFDQSSPDGIRDYAMVLCMVVASAGGGRAAHRGF